jgi:hypothetical protein
MPRTTGGSMGNVRATITAGKGTSRATRARQVAGSLHDQGDFMTATKDSTQPRRRRIAKGRRPFFFADPNTDKLLSMIAALAGEVAVLRQRVDTHERLAGQRGVFSAADVEAYAPAIEVSDERALWRQEFLQRVFRILELEYTQPEVQREEAAYSAMIASFAQPPAAPRKTAKPSSPSRPPRGGKAAARSTAAKPKPVPPGSRRR